MCCKISFHRASEITWKSRVKTSIMSTFVLVNSLDTTSPRGTKIVKSSQICQRNTDNLLTNPQIFERLTVSPQEGKAMQMHMSLHSETLEFPEECLKH